MRESLYAERRTNTEDGQELSLVYSILAIGSEYGVKIEERNSGSAALALNLTADADYIYSLADVLTRNLVTPKRLPDVLSERL